MTLGRRAKIRRTQCKVVLRRRETFESRLGHDLGAAERRQPLYLKAVVEEIANIARRMGVYDSPEVE